MGPWSSTCCKFTPIVEDNGSIVLYYAVCHARIDQFSLMSDLRSAHVTNFNDDGFIGKQNMSAAILTRNWLY